MILASVLALGLLFGQVQTPTPPAQHFSPTMTDDELPQVVRDNCFTLNDGTVMFYGPDGAVGEGDTCVGAIIEWRHETPPAPIIMNQIKFDRHR